jgi:hypothetical protein
MTSRIRRMMTGGVYLVAMLRPGLAGLILVGGAAFVSSVPTKLLAQPTLNSAVGDASPTDESDLMSEELTRGMVHEAYAQPVVFNPEAGDVVREAPPEAIEELPPEEKPEGENIEWIPGYWAWDDDENHYVWVSGLWRMIPPGLDWVPGYWTEVEGGYQWVSGFWRAEESDEIEYLPQPPQSLERGPSVSPPTDDHVWVPGSWTWLETRYAWRPGHWVTCRPGWIWVPARYVWTPYGFVHVDGYWDYALPRRGVLYAPIWFPRGYVVGHRYRYSPRVVIDVNVFSSHIFCRPTRSVYCFGDYYEARYFDRGIYPSYAYHMSRYGYDPVFAYHRWEHVRHEPNWHERMRADYRYRRDHIDARPPHTYIATQQLIARGDNRDVQSLVIATSLSGLAKRPDVGFKVESLSQQRRHEMHAEMNRWSEIQQRRRDIEVKQARLLADQQPDVRRGRPDPRDLGAAGESIRDARDSIGELGRDRPGNGKGRVIVPGQGVPGQAGIVPGVPGQGVPGQGVPGQGIPGSPRELNKSHKVKLFAETARGRPTPADVGGIAGPKPPDSPTPDSPPPGAKPTDPKPGIAGLKPGELPKSTLSRPPRKVAAEFTPPPRPDVPRPEVSRPEVRRTDIVKPEVRRTEIPKPNSSVLDSPRVDASRADAIRDALRDAQREPKNGRPERLGVENPRPEIRRPGGTPPVLPKPETRQIETPRPEIPKREIPRPETRKIELPKRETGDPKPRSNPNSNPNAAVEEIRKANERRMEDLQKQLRERQPATPRRGEEATPRSNRGAAANPQPNVRVPAAVNNPPPRTPAARTLPTTPRMERDVRANRDRQEAKPKGRDREKDSSN